MSFKLIGSLTAAVFGAVLAMSASTGAAMAAPECPDGTIKLGGISTITGPADFSEVPNATAAVFDQVNAEGGINGCQIEYILLDDKADPQVAAQSARDLVDNRGVVAMVGSASLLECQVNAGYYHNSGILSMQGLGVDAACFNVPSISPVNVGPFLLSTVMLQFSTEQLGNTQQCAMWIITGGTGEAYAEAVANWEELSGQKIHLVDNSVPFQGDYTPYVLKARDEGCDAVVFNTVEPQVVQMIKAADAQNIEGIDWLFLAPGYTVQVAEALADTNQPVYAGTEWEPFTEAGSEANEGWKAAMETAGLPLTAFSQGGYEAATLMIDVIKGIDGPVTREAVTNALHTMEPMEHPLVGTPYMFGEGDRHSSSRATKVMKLEGGEWVLETPDWFVLGD
ncbi:ABC transporter substrate-binding protein [Cucumibacter marinus]|uniref:ABC transporter substrate-binding protein n=1 Tax=Cucumibacter marinus TaxID=1121252 RepID=UPI001FE18CC0|nr:ABC transporter substrate-binding protein [Cucumibacter marinus]